MEKSVLIWTWDKHRNQKLRYYILVVGLFNLLQSHLAGRPQTIKRQGHKTGWKIASKTSELQS